MSKFEVFLKGISNGNHTRIEWIRSLFCMVAEDTDAYKTEPYPYRIIQQRDGYYYIDPDKDHTPVKITGADMNKTLLNGSDIIELKSGDLINLSKDVKTTVGNVLINAICLCYPFKKKIPFLEGVLTIKQIEKIISKRLADDDKYKLNEEGDEKSPIYVTEYLKFTEAMLFIRSLSDIFIPTVSKKLMTPPPDIKKVRDKLLEENKDRLRDPAVLAAIDKKLVEYDTQYLADDDNAQGFLLKGKYRNEVRRKQFLTVGAQSGFKDSIEVDSTPHSLNEGMKVENIAAANSAARLGSYNRGHETMLGGAKFKELLRSAANAQVSKDDCGTKEALPTYLNENNISSYIGFYIIENGNSIEITDDNKSKYINQTVMVRSPMFCKAHSVDYCKKCIGNRLSLHSQAISVAVSDVGSTFLGLFMAKMHVSGKQLQKLDLDDLLS